MNNSPWIAQLPDREAYIAQAGFGSADYCIVGAGISGIMTAYYILLSTSQSLILLDAHRVAYGATGHNAGQIAPYFEKPFDELVQQYGKQMAHDAQQAIWDAWERLKEIEDYADLQTPIQRFVGCAGVSTDHQLEEHLIKKQYREQTHNDFDAIFIRADHPRRAEWEQRFPGLFDVMSPKDIQEHLQTKSDEFIGLLACKKGVTNSALLCEELIQWMQKEYPDRFTLYEHAPVSQIMLGSEQVVLDIEANNHHNAGNIIAGRVILCTNGFEHFHIMTADGTMDIDRDFHTLVSGLVGYMSAYKDTPGQSATAISYFTKDLALQSTTDEESYFYLTRRPYHHQGQDYTLVSVGGPEMGLSHKTEYDRQAHQPDWAHQQNEQFFKSYYAPYPKEDPSFFRWHGLMGFTASGLRMIGPDPRHDRLMYNLGCNGVGILSAIYGGRKIGQICAGESFGPSVFDVG